jgi:hypothetical protein
MKVIAQVRHIDKSSHKNTEHKNYIMIATMIMMMIDNQSKITTLNDGVHLL